MGLFLSLASVVGRSQTAAVTALQDFAMQAGAVCRPATHAEASGELCVLKEEDGNTTLFFSDEFSTAENAAEYIARRLAAPVFALHLHDGDFWMYVLYYKGEVVDQFNPIPDYWDEDLSAQEAATWQGNAATIAAYVPTVGAEEVENYLVRWDLDTPASPKAYASDEYGPEAWQLLDFMHRLQLPYPITDEGPDGEVFRLGR